MNRKVNHLRSFLFLFALSACFIILMVAGTDQWCRYDINKRLPYYPGAELVSQEKDMVRYRAAGTTKLVFHTSDSPETVAEWYRALTIEQLEKGIFRGLADIQRSHESDPAGGTLIYYRTACAI